MQFNDFSTNGLLSQILEALGGGDSGSGAQTVKPVDVNGDPITQNGGIRLAGTSATSRLASSLATTNATLVKGSPGRIVKITGTNSVAQARFLKLYNKATAPVPGTDLPFWVETLEASSSFDITFPTTHFFSLGLGYAITANAPDLDATAIEAGDIATMNISYS